MISFEQYAAKFFQQILSIPSNVALNLANIDIVKRLYLYPKYQIFLEKSAGHQVPLNHTENNVIEQLQQQGIAITDLQSLNISSTEAFLDAAQTVARELRQNSQSTRYASKDTLTATAGQLLAQPEILWWGCSDTLLRIARGYLELPVAYDGLSFYYSVANGRERGPRKWHRDKEDWKMLKVCVYLHDVDQNGGPLECLKPSLNRKVCQLNRGYQVLPSCKIQQFLEPDKDNWYTSCIGKSGTVIFIDTAQYYHRGKPPTERDRSAVFFSYFSSRPRHPFFCGRSPLSDRELADLAKNLPQSARNSIMWRNKLSGIGRYIPKNRLKV